MADDNSLKIEAKPYVSIFDDDRYERNEAEAKKPTVKSLKSQQISQKQDNKQEKVVQAQEKVQQRIDISVIDYETPKKFARLKTLQNLLLWFFCKNQVNPLWIMVHNKHLIQCGVVLLFKANTPALESALNQKRLEFLSPYYQKAKMVYFRDVREQGDTADIWIQLFSSKLHDEPHFRELQKNTTNDLQEMQVKEYKDVVYKRYSQYTLTRDQQKVNLFPIKGMPAYSDYYEITNEESMSPLQPNIVAIDCEMVTTDVGLELARITVINFDLEVLMDEFVMPDREILDYNTKWSGITEDILRGVTTRLSDIQARLNKIINKETIIIGHSLENDFHAMQLIHNYVVDTSILFITKSNRKLSLKSLSQKFLNLTIQKDTHDSTEDAKITLGLARMRVEILENFTSISLQQQTAQFNVDVLMNLCKAGGIHVTESKVNDFSQIKERLKEFPTQLISHEMQSMDTGEAKFERVKTVLSQRKNQGNPKIIFSEFLSETIETSEDQQLLDSRLKQIYEIAPQNTVIIACFEDPNHARNSSQEGCLGSNYNTFFMFISK